jgi:hypothetical protein
MDLELVMDLGARLHVDMVYDISKVWKAVSKTIHLKLPTKVEAICNVQIWWSTNF